MQRTERATTVARAVVRGARSEKVTFIAAALAYYAFVSMVPLAIISVVVATAVVGPAFADAVGTQVTALLGGQAGEVVETALAASAGRTGVTVAGLVVLVWSGLRLFRGLDVAFAVVYQSERPSDLLDQLADAGVALGGVGLGVGAALAAGAAVSWTGIGGDLAVPFGLVGEAGLAVALTLALLPVYYVLPDRGVTVREALPGAVFTALGWTALHAAFLLYAGSAGSYQAYGLLGGVLLLVTLFYFGGLVLLVGAVLNAVLAGRLGTDPDLEIARTDPTPPMSEPDHDDPGVPADDDELRAELRDLRREVATLEERLEDRTVHREDIERDLRQYVRQRVRRGKARGWGPYLVLLYGTAMTIGAFVALGGGWAVLAMVVIWLSTLGLYTLMVLVGATVAAGGGLASLARSAREKVR